MGEGACLLSLIIPVFNEEEVLDASFGRMNAAMASTGCDYEIIYIDDGSKDRTLEVLEQLARKSDKVRVLSFSRNFGHQLAVTAGMDAARGNALIIIDVDLQDPPELIPRMVEMWRQGHDIVYGKRQARQGETAFKKFTAHCYYRVLTRLSAYPIPLDTGDFRLISRRVADCFLSMREHNRFLRGMSAWMGYDAVPIEYVRDQRAAGTTKYTLKKMLKLAFDGIAGFSAAPLTLAWWLGLGLLGLCGLALIALIVAVCITPISGWWFAYVGLVGVGALVLIAQGIQGAYLARAMDEVRGRPLYIVAKKIGFEETETTSA